jgi:four helix bundle protein
VATFKSFEEIEAWQKARDLSNEIYELSITGNFAKDYSLKDQINRSSGSVMDNIAEGFERGGNREFIQFLAVARGSIGEVRSQLYRVKDRNHIDPEIFKALCEKALVISKLITSLMKYLQQSDFKGMKFHESEEPYQVNPKP